MSLIYVIVDEGINLLEDNRYGRSGDPTAGQAV